MVFFIILYAVPVKKKFEMKNPLIDWLNTNHNIYKYGDNLANILTSTYSIRCFCMENNSVEMRCFYLKLHINWNTHECIQTIPLYRRLQLFTNY